MRYWKFDIELLDEEWFAVLSPASQLAYIRINVHAKSVGTRGVCKRLSPIIAARQWGIGEEDVVKAERAAVLADRLTIEDGQWRLTRWEEEQGDPGAAERMRKHRESRKSKAETPVTRNKRNSIESGSPTPPAPMPSSAPVTPVTRNHTEGDLEKDRESPPSKEGPPPARSDPWIDFVAAYPKRSGDRKAAKAEPIFRRLIKNGIDPELLVGGARRYALWCDATGKTRTELVQQMTTWLNAKAWNEPFEIPMNLVRERQPAECDATAYRKEPKEGLDFYARCDEDDQVRRYKIVGGQRTNERFDFDTWRQERGLHS